MHGEVIRKHGGDIYSFDRPVIDLSVNINPLGPGEEIKEAVRKAADDMDKYPDPRSFRLRKEIAKKDGVLPENIICGNGASEVIFNAVQALAPSKALLTAPSFSEYEVSLDAVKAEKEFHILEEEKDFRVSEKILSRISRETGVIIICNPNNPTGRLIPRELMKRIAEKCGSEGVFLIIDECFMDFTDGADENSMIPCIGKYTDMLIIRSFTKLFSCPGLRLGYGVSGNAGMLSEMEKMRQPWNISCMAERAGIAACGIKGFAEETRDFIRNERERMYRGFEELGVAGIRYVPSEADFILFYAPQVNGTGLFEALSERGILIRDCSDFRGLGKGWYRTAIGKREMNDALFRELKEIYG